MEVKLSLGVTTSYPIEFGIYTASIAERYDLRSMWIGDGIDDLRDIYTYASLVLSSSGVVEAGICMVDPFYYNISTIARSSATLVELHGERLRLGMEAPRILGETGMADSPIMDELKKAAEALRLMFRGEAVSLATPHFKLFNYSLWGRFRIPLYLGVRCLEFLEPAFEIADGVILRGPKLYLEKASRLLGEARIGRRLKVLEWIPTAILGGRSGIPDSAAKVVAVAAAETPNEVLETSGIDAGRVEPIRRMLLSERWDSLADLVDEELVEQFLFYGSPESLVDELLGWARSNGVDEVVLGPPYGLDPEKSIGEAASAWVKLSSP